MIDADVRGKLRQDGSNAHERSEDLLTSTVFGLLRYLPAGDGFIPLMCRARVATLRHGQLSVAQEASGSPWMGLSAATSCQIEFWPSFGQFGQPDLLLTLRDAARRPVHTVVIEAKLHSPKSGEAEDDGDGDAAAADADEDTWTPDQLVRYWRGVVNLPAAPDASRCSILYLTAHASPPTEDLAVSLRACTAMRLGWVSWRDIWHVVEPLLRLAQPPLAAVDLERLLANRGFKALDAFKQAAPEFTELGRFWHSRSWFQGVSAPGLPSVRRFWRTRPWFEQLVAPARSSRMHFWETA